MNVLRALPKCWAPESLYGPYKETRLVLLEFKCFLGDKSQVITHPVTHRNLKLTSEYLLEQAGVSEEKPPVAKESSSSSSSDISQSLLKVLGGEPTDLKVVKGWKDLLADADDLAKNMHLKGRVATGLRALQDLLPLYSEKDLLVVNRKSDKGLRNTELWTNRNFEALEIQFAPFSSQLKESHLMANAHAVVTLPKNGR